MKRPDTEGFTDRLGGRPRGFTLIESLVAISVLAIALVVVLQLFSGGLKAGKASEDYTRGVFYAREKMEEMLLKTPLEEGLLSGECDKTYRWEASVAPVVLPEEEVDRLPFRVVEITVRVFWNQGLREKSLDHRTTRILEKEPVTG